MPQDFENNRAGRIRTADLLTPSQAIDLRKPADTRWLGTSVEYRAAPVQHSGKRISCPLKRNGVVVTAVGWILPATDDMPMCLHGFKVLSPANRSLDLCDEDRQSAKQKLLAAWRGDGK